jgi:hypothetical protein
MLHIYTASPQPATDWTDHHSSEPMQMGWDADTPLWCGCCRRQRPARDCVVYSYYDGPLVFCAQGRGCKDPQAVADKKALEHRNRSAGQKARWRKARNAEITGRQKRSF